MRRPLGINIDRDRHIVGRHKRLLIGVVGVRVGLLNIDAHRLHIHGLLNRRDHDVDAALVRAETVTGRVTRKIGLEDETGIIDVYFLTLLEHKYQSPYLIYNVL